MKFALFIVFAVCIVSFSSAAPAAEEVAVPPVAADAKVEVTTASTTAAAGTETTTTVAGVQTTTGAAGAKLQQAEPVSDQKVSAQTASKEKPEEASHAAADSKSAVAGSDSAASTVAPHPEANGSMSQTAFPLVSSMYSVIVCFSV
ncbi:hypothetical protein Ddc_14800 [Ditylenchus destructor]|nr:hypothetical protein Ddc_14800 [Ditylenchus destructor]